jgi:hypothetical protein
MEKQDPPISSYFVRTRRILILAGGAAGATTLPCPLLGNHRYFRRLLQAGLVHVVHGGQQLGGKPAFEDEL